MFFLIRCVFWLTVVYSTIFNSGRGPTAASYRAEVTRQMVAAKTPPAAEDTAAHLSQVAQNWVTATIERLWSKAGGGCAGTPTECVALAARLSDFARRHSLDDRSARDEAQAEPVSFRNAQAYSPLAPVAEVPLPPPRPRHMGLREKPANSGFARARRFSSMLAMKR